MFNKRLFSSHIFKLTKQNLDVRFLRRQDAETIKITSLLKPR